MAILRSFVSSCELNKVDPFAWFRDVLARIPAHSIQKLHQLLPHNWAPQNQLTCWPPYKQYRSLLCASVFMGWIRKC
jgi:hypothetical protein